MSSIKNSAGDFVAPTLAGAAAAVNATAVAADLSYNPINASGATSYPITSPTWIMVYANQTDKAKGAALKTFLQYIYGPGQALATPANYAPLPQGIVLKAALQIGKIQIPA